MWQEEICEHHLPSLVRHTFPIILFGVKIRAFDGRKTIFLTTTATKHHHRQRQGIKMYIEKEKRRRQVTTTIKKLDDGLGWVNAA